MLFQLVCAEMAAVSAGMIKNGCGYEDDEDAADDTKNEVEEDEDADFRGQPIRTSMETVAAMLGLSRDLPWPGRTSTVTKCRPWLPGRI